jgi:hypothetical protein
MLSVLVLGDIPRGLNIGIEGGVHHLCYQMHF